MHACEYILWYVQFASLLQLLAKMILVFYTLEITD
jgi:hypothetical protein